MTKVQKNGDNYDLLDISQGQLDEIFKAVRSRVVSEMFIKGVEQRVILDTLLDHVKNGSDDGHWFMQCQPSSVNQHWTQKFK